MPTLTVARAAAKVAPSPPARAAAKSTPKSQRTRRRILDAAMELFAERGYQACSNADVAEAAGLTRGAMLYHFRTREDLVDAAVDHIQDSRTEAFASAARSLPQGGEVSDQAIDAYWELLRQPPFRAFAELESVARTDPELGWLASSLGPGRLRPRPDWRRVAARFLQAGSAARLETSRDLARFMLEGLSRASLTYDTDGGSSDC